MKHPGLPCRVSCLSDLQCSTDAAQAGVEKLRASPDECSTVSNKCTKFACERDAGIVVCNDTPAPYTINCHWYGEFAQLVVDACKTSGGKTVACVLTEDLLQFHVQVS
ncbi:Uu.00g079610.m01.CDS01 [Anthostomella pinea]|uniref:Uu.00g079610.m01.CDS01 n=1 Tax=Anthostomella pinea TaxID=933095 RepID=A0AAI8VLZ6_9PEZI|nr:Uu.00g079610.m01.CDS01 [Anthostomella pinea]